MISAMPAARTPLELFLLHPGQVTRHLAHLLLAVAARHGPGAAIAIAAAAAVVIAGRAWLRRRRHTTLTAGARSIEILAPPVADPAGGAALWANLAGLMRPPLARWRSGQPHLAWEYSWTAGSMTVSLWVPGGVPPGMAERAIEAAWPGAHTRTTSPAAAPLPAGCLATGGTLRLARTEILPLKTDHDADPLRALAAAGAGLGPAEHAVVQVLARPATGRRVRRARRAARKLRDGQPARLTARLLDLASPGPRAASRRAAARADPDLAAGLRAAAAKAVGPQWETLIRYAAATTALQGSGHRPTARRPPRRGGGCAATPTRSPRPRPCTRAGTGSPAAASPAPPSRSAARRLGRGDLLSVTELAAIARLPADPAVPGLTRAGARAVPPPPGIPVPRAGRAAARHRRHRAAPGRGDHRRRRPASHADHRRHRRREDHPDPRTAARRRRSRPRRGVHRPQGRRRHRPAPPPPAKPPSGRWCCSTLPPAARRPASTCCKAPPTAATPT